jgi:tetratricopeptide (TPR) repeat protein
VQGRDLSRTPLVLLVIALATTLAYAGSFSGGWISDDGPLVVENTSLHALSFENIETIATSRSDGVNYIPLNFLSLAIDRAIFGLWPPGFHLVNLMLHIATAFAIYFFVRRIPESAGLAAAAALLWAVHPVQVESVAWISERKNLLSTLFFVLAFDAYLRFSAAPRARTYLIVLLLFVAALLSKVNTIVLPAMTLIYEIAMRRRLRLQDVAAALPLFACGALVAWANLSGNTSHGATYHGGSLVSTLQTSSTTIPRYLANVVAPFDLSGYYPVILRASWLDPTVAFSVAVIAALVALTCWLAWRGAPDAFWLAWFGITLSPMLNLIPFPALMNDRYLYLPLLGALVPLLRIGQTLLQRMDALRLAPAAVAIVVAISVGLTVARVPVFRNELNLWADFGLRFSYITSDRPWGPPPRREEKQLLAEALKRHPERAALHNNVGGFAFEEGRFADALGSLERAYALGPDDPTIALNLGRTYLALNRVDDAVRTLERAVQLEPAAFFPQLNLARGYLLRGDLVRARATLERAKSIKQEPFFWQQVEQQLARAEIRAGS